MPARTKQILTILVLVSLIPLLLIARARLLDSEKTRLHIIPDMDRQPVYTSQAKGDFFPDGQAMRPSVVGTVARGELRADDAFYRGMVDSVWVAEIPMTLTTETLERGRERYNIYCAPCHGYSGMGDGAIAQRADQLQEGTWTPPSSLHTELVRPREPGHLFATISNGIRNMPPYGHQISEQDRWAIVAYIKALQLTQHAKLEDLPADEQSRLAPEEME